MLVPLSWLHEYVDFDLEPERLADRLTLMGLEVEGIERIGSDWSSVVVGELREVAPHPNAGRLSLTRVVVGGGEPELSIVCGATNIAPGQRVPVALPGAVLPGGRRIEVTRIQGAESQGMLCSGAELGLTADADGILILPDGSSLGTPLSDLLGEVVLDVDVKANRGDALSIVGVAREVAAALDTRVRPPLIEVPESGDSVDDHVRVEVRDVVRCLRFAARYVDGVTVGPSPLDVQLRLTAAGIRPISNVVDASNYVMVELGKPIHTFDAAAVSDGTIIVRTATPGEQLETLDHVTRELDPETLVIADPRGPLAMAGVIGGAASEVSDRTSAVIIESAIFDPVAVRRTARRYGLRSEASARFEKGQEFRLAPVGASRTAQLVARWAGGRVAVGVVDTDPVDPPPVRVPFRPARISRLLGASIDAPESRALLARIGIETEEAAVADDTLVAVVPAHRRDVAIEADIAEEIIRVRGYETVAPRLPDTPMPPYLSDPTDFTNRLRELLSGRGLNEVVPYNLVSPLDHARFGIAEDDPATIRAANPVSADHSQLARSLIPEMMRILIDNERQRRRDVHIFTIDTSHAWEEAASSERRTLALLLAGAATPPTPGEQLRDADVADAKGILAWLLERVATEPVRVRFESAAARHGVDHPGRTAAVVAELEARHRVELGRVAELDRRYLEATGSRSERVIVAELDAAALERLQRGPVRARRLDRVPSAERDIAVVVAEDRPQIEIEDTIHEAGGPSLRSVSLFDIYTGPPLRDGEMSLAYRLRFEGGDRPMPEAELDAAIGRIVDTLRERIGARLRG